MTEEELENRRARDRERYRINMANPEWVEAERKRNRERMAKRRAAGSRDAERAAQREQKARKWAESEEFRKACRERKRAKYNSDPEYRAAVQKRNRKHAVSEAGRHAARIREARRRFAEIACPSTLTLEEWQMTLMWQGWCCACCGKDFMGGGQPHRDHIIPASMGFGLSFDNVQGLCHSCNSRKRDRAIDYRSKAHRCVVQEYLSGYPEAPSVAVPEV